MTAPVQYVLYTHQPGAIGAPADNVYGTDPDSGALETVGHLLADGAEPPMTFLVVPLQPAEWGSL
jgi:hypothetical protein